MNKKVKWIIIIVVIVVVVILLGGVLKKCSERSGPGSGFDISSKMKEAVSDCESNPNPQLTHDITDTEKIGYIVPPGNVEEYPEGNVFKSHSYIKGPNKVPIYAPVDSELFKGVYVDEGGINQYALFFEVSCEVFYLFDHVVDVSDKIKAVFPDQPQTQTNTQEVKRVPVKAGEIIGYSIGPEFEQWDFGVYNNSKSHDLSGIDAPLFDRDKIADCPYDYFPEDKKEFYYSKFDSHLTGVPVPTILCSTQN